MLLAFAAAGSPLLFGSTNAFMIAFWCVVLGISLIICNPEVLRKNHRILLSLSAAVAIAFSFVVHEQIALQPWIAASHPLWAEAAKGLGEPVLAAVSIARNQPWFSIGAPLVAILTLTVSVVVSSDRILAWRLIWILAWAGAAYAIYSIAAFLVDPTKVLWREKLGHFGGLTGTFLNQNTAATFFGSCSVVWFLIVFEQIKKLLPRRPFSFSDGARRILNQVNVKVAFFFGPLLICLAALFLTRSRAGVMLSLVALLIAAACSFHRLLFSKMAVLGAALLAGTVLLLLLQTMGAGVGSRIDLEGVVDRGRSATYRSTLTMIRDRPWFGTGLGTFEMAFPAYRSGEISMSGTWNRAHNTLLELTSDLGIPLATIIVVGWLLIIAQLIRGSLRRRRDVALPTAGLAVGVLGLSHSLIDFSLQIPGYTIPFCAIVGAGLAQSFSMGDYRPPTDRRAARPR